MANPVLDAARYIPSPGIPMSGYIPTNLPAPVKFGGALLGGLAAASLAIDAIGWLGGNKFRDDQLGRIRGKEPNSGYRDAPPSSSQPGQQAGVAYRIQIKVTCSDAPDRYGMGSAFGSLDPLDDAWTRSFGIPLTGAITGALSVSPAGAFAYNVYLSGNYIGYFLSFGTNPQASIYKIVREDGQPDTGGSPSTEPPTPTGYTGSPPEIDRKNQPRITPPNLAPALGWGNGKPLNVAPALDIGAKSPSLGEAFAPTIPPATPDKPRPTAPPATPPATPATPSQPQAPTKKEEDKRSPFVPTPSELGNINNKLFEIGSILGFINANTQPSAQRVNAKNGTCDAMQSPSCTQGFENRIKDPINQNIDAKTGLLAANQAAQDAALGVIATEQQAQKGVLATIAAKATDIFNLVGGLWNNGIVDKAMQYITMITVIHNAAMLTRGIADTLGSALDLGLQAFGLQIKDKDGNQLGVTQVIGKSFENLIKGIIGADNYTALTETWVQANRIYQTGINLISNVQNILDSTTAVAELTSNRVGTLMNALRNAGMVRENAYGAQSQNVTKFNAFQNKLEALEQGVSNTASIAGNIVSVQQLTNEFKSNRQEFENALKNKPQGSGLPENNPEKQAAQQKKDQSIYTISDFSVVKPPENP